MRLLAPPSPTECLLCAPSTTRGRFQRTTYQCAASTIVPPPARASLLLPRSLSPWRWGGVRARQPPPLPTMPSSIVNFPTPPPRRGLNAARAHQRFSACLPTSASNFPRADEGNVARHSPLTPHSCSPHRIHACVRTYILRTELGIRVSSHIKQPTTISPSIQCASNAAASLCSILFSMATLYIPIPPCRQLPLV